MQGTQVRIDDRDLRAVLAHAFGDDASGITATVIGDGQINDTRLLTWPDGAQRIFRVAPSDAFAAAGPSWFTPYGLRREADVIAAASDLARYLPVTFAHDFERRVIDRDWVVQEVVPGVPLVSVEERLPTKERARVWREIGAITARLHAHQWARFGPPWSGTTFERWSDLATHDLDGFVVDAARFGLDPAPFQRLRELLDTLRPALDDGVKPSLIHSDLSPDHVFVRFKPGNPIVVTGMIDLEFGRYADPLSESLFAWFAQQRGSRSPYPAFLEGYGRSSLTGEEQVRVRFATALSLGWWTTLLAYQGRPVDRVLLEFEQAIEAAGSSTRSSPW